MLHQSHACITGPALLVVITHNVLIIGVWVLRKVPLDQISGLVSREPGRAIKTHNINLSAKTEKSALLGSQAEMVNHDRKIFKKYGSW